MLPPPPLRLSQSHLTLLETCPRKFQHVYLEQLAPPPDPDQQLRLQAGSAFHLVMQQRELGLPIEPLVQADTQLQAWYQAFVAAAPHILGLELADGAWRQAEYPLTLEWQGYLLTVVYDLLILAPQQARILDWKTYPRPLQSRWLAENWQTRLYPFVLAETSPYTPEQIAILYWFFQATAERDSAPQSLQFPYSQRQHDTIRQTLTDLLSRLTGWLQRYQEGIPFPQVPVGAKVCTDCDFAQRCQRLTQPQNGAIDLLALDQIQEIPL